jgi:FkbM family methyltransferase
MSAAVKAPLQRVLRKVGLYQRLKFSWLYDAYWKLNDRKWVDDRDRELKFFRDTLRGFKRGDLIFDIGANHGQKTDIFLRLGARVVAVDPDASNQEVLRQSFCSYRLIKKPVVILGKAVSDRNGKETMWIDEPGSAKNTLNSKWVETLRADSKRFGSTLQFSEKREVETTTLEDMFHSYGRPFYIKVDVEGHEVSVLNGMETPVPYLSFEVNLPEFLAEAIQCVGILHNIAPAGQFSYTADCREGLACDQWVPRDAFLEALASCQLPCIEVFWRSSPDIAAGNNSEEARTTS